MWEESVQLLLVVNMLWFLASLFSSFLFTAWRPSKETFQGFLSAPPPFLVKDIVSGFMWTLIFHRHCWFHHLQISLILKAVIGLDLFFISFVTPAGKAAALLMNFVGLIFDSILTAKADSLFKAVPSLHLVLLCPQLSFQLSIKHHSPCCKNQ